MAPDNTAPHPDNPASHDELLPGRRSFPAPRRREEQLNEEPAPGWQHWAVRGLLALAVGMAGTAAWIKLRSDNSPRPAPPAAAAIPAPEFPAPGPPDAARDIYLSAVLPDPPLTPAPPPTSAENPPASLRDLTDLEARYLGALTAAMKHVPEPARAEFAAEIERLNTDAPLPPSGATMHPELARLQSIYRLQLARQLQR